VKLLPNEALKKNSWRNHSFAGQNTPLQKKFLLTNAGAFLIKTHGLAKQNNKGVAAELHLVC